MLSSQRLFADNRLRTRASYWTSILATKNAGSRYPGAMPSSRTRVAFRVVPEGTCAARSRLPAIRQVWDAAIQRHQAGSRLGGTDARSA